MTVVTNTETVLAVRPSGTGGLLYQHAGVTSRAGEVEYPRHSARASLTELHQDRSTVHPVDCARTRLSAR